MAQLNRTAASVNSTLLKVDGIETGAQVNTITSVNGNTGAVNLDKTDIGLENVDNTADADKPVSTATQTELDLKLDISSYTATDVKTKYESNANTNAFTDTLQTKLDGIESGAEVNTVDSVNGYTGGVVLSKTDVGLSDVTNDAQIPLSQKGVANGVAELDSSGKLTSSQIPSSVDSIQEYADFASLPTTGESNIIYVTTDDNKTYRWSGTQYVEISASLTLGETSSTAYRGDRGATAYTHSQVVSGNPHSVSASDVGLGSVVNADTTTTANITDSTDKRFITDAQETKLDGIESGATANSSDATLLNRANHTGTQTASTISDFNDAVESGAKNFSSSVTVTGDLIQGSHTVASGSKTLTKETPTLSNEAISLSYLNTTTSSYNGNYIPVYCVNSGYMTGSDEDIVNKVSDTEISFNVDDGTTYTSITMTYPDNTQEILTSLTGISGISGDANYIIVKEKGSDPTLVSLSTNSITENYGEPSGGTDGDYWLNIAVKPYVPYKRISGVWTVTQFIKIGEITVSSSVMDTPITYAFNGVKTITETVASTTSYTISDNMGTINKDVYGVFNNITGSDNTTAIPNGSNGFKIGLGYQSVGGAEYWSGIGLFNNNTFRLRCGNDGLYGESYPTSSAVIFTGADVVITIKRNF